MRKSNFIMSGVWCKFYICRCFKCGSIFSTSIPLTCIFFFNFVKYRNFSVIGALTERKYFYRLKMILRYSVDVKTIFYWKLQMKVFTHPKNKNLWFCFETHEHKRLKIPRFITVVETGKMVHKIKKSLSLTCACYFLEC